MNEMFEDRDAYNRKNLYTYLIAVTYVFVRVVHPNTSNHCDHYLRRGTIIDQTIHRSITLAVRQNVDQPYSNVQAK